ncbi:hypothetical protein ABIC52_002776 [Curtobacterium oceanosedimentum]
MGMNRDRRLAVIVGSLVGVLGGVGLIAAGALHLIGS